MPELPEVYGFTYVTNREIKNDYLVGIQFISGKYAICGKRTINYINELQHSLPLKVNGMKCKGKFSWFDFKFDQQAIPTQNTQLQPTQNTQSQPTMNKTFDWKLGISFGLEGRLSFFKPKEDKYVRVIYTFKRHNSTQVYNLYYYDSCNYGNITVYRSQSELNTKLDTIGDDLRTTQLTDDNFVELCRKHNTMSFTQFLMCQKYIAGVGNYVKSETLFLGRINPHAKINQLSDGKLKRYYERCRIFLTFMCHIREVKFSAFMYIETLENQSNEYMCKYLERIQKIITYYDYLMNKDLQLTGDDKIFKNPISLVYVIHHQSSYKDLNGIVYDVVCEKAPKVGGRKTYYVKEFV